MESTKLISATRTESPVDLTGFKNHIGFSIADATRDESFTLLLDAATDEAQSYSGLQLLPAIFELQLNEYKQVVLFDIHPVTGINQVKYFDASNEEQILVSGTDYYFNVDANPAELHFINELNIYPYRTDAIVVNFGAGYASAAKVPPLVKAAILLAAANMYVNPADSVRVLPTASRNLLRNYRTHNT
ncbi:MAG: hypothetical protein OEY01_11120 [Desulfobulbaceae bacterium]|nr:hypothetical protein [Desulfobulbaceae bacterium]